MSLPFRLTLILKNQGIILQDFEIFLWNRCKKTAKPLQLRCLSDSREKVFCYFTVIVISGIASEEVGFEAAG
jgi:hypothetical protein